MTLCAAAGAADAHVVDRIEHRDGLAVDVDGVRHVHVGAERAADPFGDDGLAVAGRAVEEERLARVHRRTELVVHRLVDDQALEALREAVAIDPGPRRHAGADVGVVLRQRHRRRADVAVDVEELHRPVAAEIGQDVAVAGGAGAAGAAHLDQLLDARVLDHRVEHRVGQPQASASCVPLLSPATSVFSISCDSVSGCRPVSAMVAGGGGGVGCARPRPATVERHRALSAS